MHLYMSGTPSDDHYQVIENQICTHRLFSMFEEYRAPVMKWLDTIKSGVRTFDDFCAGKIDLLRRLEHQDKVMRRILGERGVTEKWIPYAEVLRSISDRLGQHYPRHIMLDSGAFSAWNAKKTVSLDEVKRAYTGFLKNADALFDEIWLINLDVIPGKKGQKPSAEELKIALGESDVNLNALRAEFGDRVLPVFHRDEGKGRFLEVIDQAQGYLCLSPTNEVPEEKRWHWATDARIALSYMDCNVRTHGLATTGNDMIRHGTFYSGDSIAWKDHGNFGVVDLVSDEAMTQIRPVTKMVGPAGHSPEFLPQVKETYLEEVRRPQYKGYHIGRERNDFDRKAGVELIDKARHFKNLPIVEQQWVRSRVEAHVPFLLAQFDAHARALVNIAELRSYAESIPWREPQLQTLIDGVAVDKDSPLYHEVRPYPLAEDRQRFLANRTFDHL